MHVHCDMQENMAGLRSELAVLDSIPEGQLGRVLAGDTTIDELRASEQRLLAEVAARKERKAERQVQHAGPSPASYLLLHEGVHAGQ